MFVLTVVVALVFHACLIAEIWMGTVVTGFTDESPFIERKENPGAYWFMITIHIIAAVGIQLLALIAKV